MHKRRPFPNRFPFYEAKPRFRNGGLDETPVPESVSVQRDRSRPRGRVLDETHVPLPPPTRRRFARTIPETPVPLPPPPPIKTQLRNKDNRTGNWRASKRATTRNLGSTRGGGVKVIIQKKFEKGYMPDWSDEVYTVQSVSTRSKPSPSHSYIVLA